MPTPLAGHGRRRASTLRGAAPGGRDHRAISLLLAWAVEMIQALEAHARTTAGLSQAQLETLRSLVHAQPQGLRMNDLAAQLVVSKSGLTYCVDQLEDRGFVVRSPSADDGRVVLVSLTAAGRAVAEAADPGMETLADEMFYSRLTPEEAALLERLLTKLSATR